MKKIIQRTTDNKYLVSFFENIWTDNIEEAKVFNRSGESRVTIMKLSMRLGPDNIKEIEL
tara:strand:+ start:137 stop:316 length:180 start_codon:yes stop_codon:yes gene_type:complete